MKCFARYHDSASAYTRYGCRCPESVAAMRLSWRRRAKNKYWRRKRVDNLGRVPMSQHRQRILDEQRERIEMALPLLRQGVSNDEIAYQLHIARRTVQRYAVILRREGLLDECPSNVG